MKLLSIVSLCAAAATALPATIELSSRASISKADGLKFNVDGVTKCKFADL
jgi:mannan endo-1,4-beta-mannosidase